MIDNRIRPPLERPNTVAPLERTDAEIADFASQQKAYLAAARDRDAIIPMYQSERSASQRLSAWRAESGARRLDLVDRLQPLLSKYGIIGPEGPLHDAGQAEWKRVAIHIMASLEPSLARVEETATDGWRDRKRDERIVRTRAMRRALEDLWREAALGVATLSRIAIKRIGTLRSDSESLEDFLSSLADHICEAARRAASQRIELSRCKSGSIPSWALPPRCTHSNRREIEVNFSGMVNRVVESSISEMRALAIAHLEFEDLSPVCHEVSGILKRELDDCGRRMINSAAIKTAKVLTDLKKEGRYDGSINPITIGSDYRKHRGNLLDGDDPLTTTEREYASWTAWLDELTGAIDTIVAQQGGAAVMVCKHSCEWP